MSPLIVTEKAAKRVADLIAKKADPNLMLRVTVLGGGCSGFQYKIGLDALTQEEDQVFEFYGIKLVSDPSSLGLLEGATLDYVEEMIGASFQIKNPNAASSCGCGNSFAV